MTFAALYLPQRLKTRFIPQDVTGHPPYLARNLSHEIHVHCGLCCTLFTPGAEDALRCSPMHRHRHPVCSLSLSISLSMLTIVYYILGDLCCTLSIPEAEDAFHRSSRRHPPYLARNLSHNTHVLCDLCCTLFISEVKDAPRRFPDVPPSISCSRLLSMTHTLSISLHFLTIASGPPWPLLHSCFSSCGARVPHDLCCALSAPDLKMRFIVVCISLLMFTFLIHSKVPFIRLDLTQRFIDPTRHISHSLTRSHVFIYFF